MFSFFSFYIFIRFRFSSRSRLVIFRFGDLSGYVVFLEEVVVKEFLGSDSFGCEIFLVFLVLEVCSMFSFMRF